MKTIDSPLGHIDGAAAKLVAEHPARLIFNGLEIESARADGTAKTVDEIADEYIRRYEARRLERYGAAADPRDATITALRADLAARDATIADLMRAGIGTLGEAHRLEARATKAEADLAARTAERDAAAGEAAAMRDALAAACDELEAATAAIDWDVAEEQRLQVEFDASLRAKLDAPASAGRVILNRLSTLERAYADLVKAEATIAAAERRSEAAERDTASLHRIIADCFSALGGDRTVDESPEKLPRAIAFFCGALGAARANASEWHRKAQEAESLKAQIERLRTSFARNIVATRRNGHARFARAHARMREVGEMLIAAGVDDRVYVDPSRPGVSWWDLDEGELKTYGGAVSRMSPTTIKTLARRCLKDLASAKARAERAEIERAQAKATINQLQFERHIIAGLVGAERNVDSIGDAIRARLRALEAAEARAATAERALAPFAKLADWYEGRGPFDDEPVNAYEDAYVTVGDLRSARAALTAATVPVAPSLDDRGYAIQQCTVCHLENTSSTITRSRAWTYDPRCPQCKDGLTMVTIRFVVTDAAKAPGGEGSDGR